MTTEKSELGRGSRRATMHDVAERAGVALSSVSRALSDHPDVSSKMRDRVKSVASELGYEPDLLAQSLRRGSTNTIGFVVRDIANPFFAEIANGSEHVLRRSGHSMLLTNSDGDIELEAEHTKVLRRRRVDGLILSLVSETEGSTIDLLHSTNMSLVLLDREVEGVEAGSVLSDHYTGVRAAVNDLVSMGHRRIALISGSPTIRPTRERIRGLTDAMADHGLAVDPGLILTGSFDADFARRETTGLLDASEPPTAVVTGGVQSTLGALEAMVDRGVIAGEDVAFVACDELRFFDVFRPPLSVVARNPERIGAEAAKLLLGMNGGGRPHVVTVPTEYRRRASSSPLPAT